MTKKYDYAVFIGRFQPFHNGHYEVIRQGLEMAHNVLVLVGSAYSPRTYRNPFLYEERANMIYGAFNNISCSVGPIDDFTYNDALWVKQVQDTVSSVVPAGKSVALIGHAKDHTSFYLKLFPQWDSIDVEGHSNLDGTKIRALYFSRIPTGFEKQIPEWTKKFLDEFYNSDEYRHVLHEYETVQTGKKKWSCAPYPPTFVTVDACVVQSGHVLLVKRKKAPGKGLWALPGGFLNPDETIMEGMLRELKEETKIKVPLPVLQGSIVTTRVFDSPTRSSRGRTITHASLISLRPELELPAVKGSDDAEKAKWWALSDVRRDMMFEDHMDVLNNLTALL